MNCIRRKSKKGEYHIIITFTKELEVFSCKDDRKKFIEIMVKVMEKMGCKIYAHTIMLNHAHLIIKEGKDKKISSILISLCTRFAKYFNKAHNRKGRVFSRRYKSIPINDDIYLFIVFRYIDRNAVKAMLVKEPWEYGWSSAKDYFNKEGDFYFPEIIERFDKVFKYHPYTLEEFVSSEGDNKLAYYLSQITTGGNSLTPPFSIEEFLNSPVDDKMILDIELKRYYDDEAIEIYKKEVSEAGIDDLKSHNSPVDRVKIIRRMRRIGLTLIQIRKFSGMSPKELEEAMYPIKGY